MIEYTCRMIKRGGCHEETIYKIDNATKIDGVVHLHVQLHPMFFRAYCYDDEEMRQAMRMQISSDLHTEGLKAE